MRLLQETWIKLLLMWIKLLLMLLMLLMLLLLLKSRFQRRTAGLCPVTVSHLSIKRKTKRRRRRRRKKRMKKMMRRMSGIRRWIRRWNRRRPTPLYSLIDVLVLWSWGLD